MRSLIFGIHSQDARFLSQTLARSGLEVIGIQNLDRSSEPKRSLSDGFSSFTGASFRDLASLREVLLTPGVSSVYNLVGFSSVQRSFKEFDLCMESNLHFFQRLLDAAKGISSDLHIFQCSSSEMYAGLNTASISESTSLSPISPYGLSKASAHYLAKIYRETYGVKVSCGILFNHESEYRPSNFFSKKVVEGLVDVHLNIREKIHVNTLDFRRDWSYAEDFAKAFQLIASQQNADDYVVASGQLHSGRDFVQACIDFLGMRGEIEDYVEEVTIDSRPTDHKGSAGDNTKIRLKLNWSPTFSFEAMVSQMIDAELRSRRGS